MLLRLPASFDQLSTKQFYQYFGQPCTERVVRLDGLPLPPCVPSHGVVPVWLGKKANEVTLSEAHLLLSDFGEAFSPQDPQTDRRVSQCHTPLAVSPPEAFFEPDTPLSFPVDIWALACAIWSMFSPRQLFDATLATPDDISCQRVDLLGSLPHKWWMGWDARFEYFERDGEAKKDRFVYPSLEKCFEQDIQASRRRSGMCGFDDDEARAILDMLRQMFAFRPEERASAEAVLSSEWMTIWGLPAAREVCELRKS